jgi:glycosyltransferase involved in cell wall biosynthesis
MTLHLHVPIPGELVSPQSGSALVSIARALGEAQLRAGGRAAFVARAGMPHDPRPLDLVEAAIAGKTWHTAGEKVVDRVFGAALDRYVKTDELWAPIFDAIPPTHDGLVFMHNGPAAAPGLRRARPRAQGVVYLHNEVTKGWPRLARRRLVRQHRVVCDSRFTANRLVQGSADRGDVLALVNGTDTVTFRPSDREIEPTILFVGKVSPHKGPDLLVEAARLLHAEGLEFRLRIVGGAVLEVQEGLTDFEQQLRARAEVLGDRVVFEPFVDRDHIADVYGDATIMVVPSNWDEPCSLTLPEGLAAGLACVASNRGGLPEMGGDAPLYFTPPDVRELASCLRLLLTDEDERRDRAAAARARAEEVTWDKQLATLVEWLESKR